MNPQDPINDWFRRASAHADVITSLATRLQIDTEPLDTFAARAHDVIRAKAAPTDDDLTTLAHDIYNLLPDGYKTPLPAERNTIAGILAYVFGFLRDFGQDTVICGPQLLSPLKALCARYSLPVAPLDTLAERLLEHLVQMERDAAEAHSAAKALGVEVKDLADMAKTLRRSETTAATVAADARDSLAKVEAKLQAINEALPADLRHSDDLAAAVRTLAERDDEVVPAIQTVAALRYALESPHLCLALARELYDADDNLLTLLEEAHRPSLAETLLATLATNRAAPEYPPLPKPSALARTLEGPAKVAYFNHSRRAGRVEAIGEDLIRFYPVEGDPVTLNATRRDLEVYHLTADELATEIARAEARKTPPAESPPAAVADDDIPF